MAKIPRIILSMSWISVVEEEEILISTTLIVSRIILEWMFPWVSLEMPLLEEFKGLILLILIFYIDRLL